MAEGPQSYSLYERIFPRLLQLLEGKPVTFFFLTDWLIWHHRVLVAACGIWFPVGTHAPLLQSHQTLRDPMDCNPPGSLGHGIFPDQEPNSSSLWWEQGLLASGSPGWSPEVFLGLGSLWQSNSNLCLHLHMAIFPLCVSVPEFPFSYEDMSHWIKTSPKGLFWTWLHLHRLHRHALFYYASSFHALKTLLFFF